MTYRCSGKKEGGMACKTALAKPGYCRYHQDQETGQRCKCFLDNGSSCSYPAGANGLCEYHVQPGQCQGRTIIGGLCLRVIASGKYCWNCKGQEDVINEGVRLKAEEMRKKIVEKTGLIPTRKKPLNIPIGPLDIQLNIPANLKKIELAKPDDCCICQDPISGTFGLDYRSLKCGHCFHADCLSKICKLECPLCRAVITKPSIPKWIYSRIEENIGRAHLEEQEQQFQATQRLIQEIIGQDVTLDIDSSEEEDLNHHVNNNARMIILPVLDDHGDERLALVVMGESPN